MTIIKPRKIYYSISGILLALAIGSLFAKGINLSPDFTGDAVIDVEAKSGTISADDVRRELDAGGISVKQIEQTSERRLLIRTDYLTEDGHQEALRRIKTKGDFEEKSFESTGPTVGRQLRRNAILALVLAMAAIVVYIAWAFRKVSKPVSSWVYGIIAIVALLHDVVIPTGIFSYYQIPVDALFISALLTILGFSVHDTIVVFDRIRENLRKTAGGNFETIVEKSLKETITRSINTSLTTVLSLFAIYFFGGETTQDFALALILGIVVGTYSSIFIASPLLVTFAKFRSKNS